MSKRVDDTEVDLDALALKAKADSPAAAAQAALFHAGRSVERQLSVAVGDLPANSEMCDVLAAVLSEVRKQNANDTQEVSA
jgi:hypothetical protein